MIDLVKFSEALKLNDIPADIISENELLINGNKLRIEGNCVFIHRLKCAFTTVISVLELLYLEDVINASIIERYDIAATYNLLNSKIFSNN